jgi:hypothetical protein
VRKKQYEKAEAIFYKAYLYDPTDPFTLNNLGYISELRASWTALSSFMRWHRNRAARPSSTAAMRSSWWASP